MNLLEEPWIPVRTAQGRRRRIAPHEITDGIDTDPIVRLDAPRADFNGALMQFLIGLVQTAWARAGRRWDRTAMLFDPPSPDALREAFLPLRAAFEFDGDGTRFMQDATLGAADAPAENGIAALLIESPGEQATERNTDHFVKRGRAAALCPACAATALFTLMTNAPSGGAGHRTSLRGGGPLTTLLLYDAESPDDPPPALWRDVASNVLDPRHLKPKSDKDLSAPKFTFPWLAPISELQPRAETQPLDVHPCQMYWAMPRRIRLDFSNVLSGTCALCGEASDHLVTRYLTKNYGMNYKGPWRHPLSPYQAGKADEPPLPMHPQPGGLGYRHWLGWVLGLNTPGKRIEPARVIQACLAEQPTANFRLWAFGYDMDNMKARCWYESTFPLFELSGGDDARDALRAIVDSLLQPAELAAFQLRCAVRDAWFGAAGARGDLTFVDASFWSATEAAFFQHVREAAALANSEGRGAYEASLALRRRWLGVLQSTAYRLFEQHAGDAAAGAIRPERLALAHATLRSQLHGAKLAAAAGLEIERQPGKAKSTRKKQAEPQGV